MIGSLFVLYYPFQLQQEKRRGTFKNYFVAYVVYIYRPAHVYVVYVVYFSIGHDEM